MALLRLESGAIYSSVMEINQKIAPHQCGHFDLSYENQRRFAEPLKHEPASVLYPFIPESLNSYCLAKGLIRSGAASFSSNSAESVKQRITDSALSHLDLGDEVHICFGGGLIIYLQINEMQMALVVQAGDWIFIKRDCPVWVKPTSDYLFNFVSYHTDKRDPIRKNYISCPDKNVL